MSLRTFCQKCLFNSSLRQIFNNQRQTYRSVYNLEQLYPNSNQDTLRQNRYESSKPGFSGVIPIDKLQIKTTRGGGPGGQNVQMTSNKVEVRFHVESADWIPDDLKHKFKEQESHRINKEGYFITTSHKTRKVALNQGDCIDKIRKAIYSCMTTRQPPTKQYLQIVEKRLLKQQRERLREKRFHSMKKRDRQCD